MNLTTSFKIAAAVASVTMLASLAPVYAEEETDDATISIEGVTLPKAEKFFHPLLRCLRTAGCVQVLKPRSKQWVVAQEGHYYPLGSVVRVAGMEKVQPYAEFSFGDKAKVIVNDEAQFATREVPIGEKTRALVLKAGKIKLDLPRQLPDGSFKVVAPFFECYNVAGESTFDYNASAGDGDEVVVRCITGTMAIKGLHYVIAHMAAANQVRIRTSSDNLFTALRGESGDYKVTLDKGLKSHMDFDTGKMVEEAESLEFALSPKCAVKIFRAKSTIGGRMSVSMMTFGATGEMMNRFAYAEGLSSVNSGELVIPKNVEAAAAKEAQEANKKAEEEDDDETVEVKPAKDDEDKSDSDDSEDSLDDSDL